MKPDHIIYYSDPLSDDFAQTAIHTRDVEAGFPYVRKSRPWNYFAALLYYLVAVPVVYLISKVYLGLKFENRDASFQIKARDFFSTEIIPDILTPFFQPLLPFQIGPMWCRILTRSLSPF